MVIRIDPNAPANTNRKAPPKPAAAPAVFAKGSIDKAVPAPIENVPPIPIMSIGQIKLLMVSPVIRYQINIMNPPSNVKVQPSIAVLTKPIWLIT